MHCLASAESLLVAGISATQKFTTSLFATEVSKCGEEYLQCRESLLAVDDLPNDNMPGRALLLVKHHCPPKMGRRIATAIEGFRELPFNVLPKGGPLVFLIPNLLTLK